MAKGSTLIVFAWWVIASAIWHGVYGTLPHPDVMGLVASAALLANGSVALLLYGFLSSFSDGNELGALPLRTTNQLQPVPCHATRGSGKCCVIVWANRLLAQACPEKIFSTASRCAVDDASETYIRALPPP